MQSEVETWLRAIDFVKAENNYLKNRLSEVIQNDVSFETLDQIENYQNNFITKDTIIALLVKDITAHKKSLSTAPLPEKDTINTHNKLRDDIGKIEREFITTAANFNKFLMIFLNGIG